MDTLITDRDQVHVDRLNTLSRKGWANMTDAEKAEWSGDPFLFAGANHLPYGPNYPAGVELSYADGDIVATAVWDGAYVYAVSIIGPAADYAGKTFTLSAEYMRTIGGATPQLILFWHDDNGYEYAGGPLNEAGSTTFTLAENTGNRDYLAMYVYVATDVPITAGAVVRYGKVMLAASDTQQPYAPYWEVVLTDATKGGYNFSDLNRVERAVARVSELYGLGLTTKTDWTMWDIPTQSQMARYLANVAAIQEAIGTTYTLPKSMEMLTYTGANNIEKVLVDALSQASAMYYAGDIFTGEVS